jgi:hypothetical protein
MGVVAIKKGTAVGQFPCRSSGNLAVSVDDDGDPHNDGKIRGDPEFDDFPQSDTILF